LLEGQDSCLENKFRGLLTDKGTNFFNYHNSIRTDPKSWIPTLKEMLTKFDKENPLLFQTADP
jgi:hypothetical protein